MMIRLSRLARQDLDDIRRYTLDTWGHGQWLKYYRGLVDVFEGIMANPDAGRGSMFLTSRVPTTSPRLDKAFSIDDITWARLSADVRRFGPLI